MAQDIENAQTAIGSRVPHLEEQADSSSFECVSRLLKKDLGSEENANNKVIDLCLQKCLEDAGNDDAPKILREAGEKVACTRDSTEGTKKESQSEGENDLPEYEEKMGHSSVLGLLNKQKGLKFETKKAEGNGRRRKGLVPYEILIKKAIRKRSSYLKVKANAETATRACFRRLLEEDLKLDKFTLDPYTKFIRQQLDEELSYFRVSRLAQQPNCSPRDIVCESDKDSCSPDNVEAPPSQNVLRDLAILAMELDGGSAKLDLEHEHHEHFYLGKVDLLHLCSGADWLDVSHLALWCTYLHRFCITKVTSHLYGFLDPYKICSSNHQESIQTYIQNKLLNDQRKTCYLGPYLHSGHWKLLIICPKSNTVVWMCSMHHRPDPSVKRIVNGAMEAYNLATEDSRKKKPNWLIPKVPKQNNGYACGYYVMLNMLTIISGDIVSSWEETFIDESPFEETLLDNIQQTWAQCFMTMYDQHNLKPKKRSQARNAKQKQ